MCYFLYLASPLTLSEVRSMLAPGLTAELLPPDEHRALLRLHPEAQTAARLLHGACSCDLVRQRLPVTTADEAHLRARYKKLGLSRDTMIEALENHRRMATGRHRQQPWPAAVSSFVVEHARNAGPTLYYLDFTPHVRLKVDDSRTTPARITTTQVRENPGVWLPEKEPVMVVRG
jgi:hypothetical protein